MNKNSSFLQNFFFVIVPISICLFIYVFVLAEIKVLNRDKVRSEELLVEKRNKIEMKLVEIQKLSAEERIVAFAADSLGLIRSQKQFDNLSVSKDQIMQLKKLIESKYE